MDIASPKAASVHAPSKPHAPKMALQGVWTKCAGGRTVEVLVVEVCTRDTDGVVLNEGTTGVCQFDDPCSQTGDRSRTDRGENGHAPETRVLAAGRPMASSCQKAFLGAVRGALWRNKR